MNGLKYILAGYVIGTLVSSFTFGQPYLLEDLIRAKFRGMTVRPFMERGYIPMYIINKLVILMKMYASLLLEIHM